MLKIDRWSFCLLLISFCVLLPNLHVNTLMRWDEAGYAEIAREILLSGDWLTLHYNTNPWFEKPPLFFWCIAISYKIFGINEFAIRFPVLLTCVGAIMLTYFIARHLYSQSVAGLAALILLFTFPFIQFGRIGMIDMPLTFLCLLGIWGYLQLSPTKNRWWYLIWGVFGFATLLKSAAASLLPLMLCAFCLLADKKSLANFFESRHFWYGFILYLFIIIPWHLFMTLLWGNQFWNTYLLYTVFKRMAIPIESHITSPFYYIKLLTQNYPWSIFLVFAIGVNVWNSFRSKKALTIPFLMLVIPLLVYSLCSTRLAGYVLLVYPAIAILNAALIYQVCIEISKQLNLLAMVSMILLLIPNFKQLYVPHKGQVATLAMSIKFQNEPILSPGQSYSSNPRLPEIAFYSKRALLLVHNQLQLIELIKQKRSNEFVGEREWLTSLPSSLRVQIHKEIGSFVYATLEWG